MDFKFSNEALTSLEDGDTKYHDDMFGEEVFITLDQKPSFIHSYDYREFNGVPIKIMAEVLQEYQRKIIQADCDYFQWRSEYFNQSNKFPLKSSQEDK